MTAPTPAEIDAFVARTLRGRPYNFSEKKYLTDISSWAVFQQGYELDVTQILDWDVINLFARYLLDAYPKTTITSIRGTLRALGRGCNPTWFEPYIVSTPQPRKTREIYTDLECQELISWSLHSPSKRIDLANRRLMVELCLGAGLTALEAGMLTWEQVYCDSDGVVLLDIAGRDVPVRDSYSRVLAERREVSSTGSFVLSPKRKLRKDVCVSICKHPESLSATPRPKKMRDTWVAHLIQSGLPERVILAAAGLKTFRGFETYFQESNHDLDTVRSFVQGAIHVD